VLLKGGGAVALVSGKIPAFATYVRLASLFAGEVPRAAVEAFVHA
jgi:hypothetical protein